MGCGQWVEIAWRETKKIRSAKGRISYWIELTQAVADNAPNLYRQMTEKKGSNSKDWI